MNTRSKNRRKETRFRSSAGMRLSWKSEEASRARRKGWTLDTSSNGIGFLAEKPRLPQPGQVIAVRPSPHADPQHYEVVRVTPLPGKLAVIGGERVYGKAAPNTMPPPAWSREQASPAVADAA